MGEGIYRIFDSVWRLSLVGGYCILLVMLARILLKKAPKWCSYLLWAIVFVRLCCPVLPETGISIIPERLLNIGTGTSTVADGGAGQRGDAVALEPGGMAGTDSVTGMDGGDNWRWDGTSLTTDRKEPEPTVPNYDDALEDMGVTPVNATGGSTGMAGTNGTDPGSADMAALGDIAANTVAGEIGGNAAQARPVWFRILAWVWLLGMCGFFGYHAFSYLRMRRRLRRADGSVREVEPGICEIDGGHLSFVMGLLHPVIYLSAGLDPESRRVVLCHEQVHLQRRDYLFKPAALIICCVHWFNPLVWLAFYLMNMDCEMSCDEKVVKLLGEESKKIYSYTLLEEASGGEWKRYRGGSICALLSFGEDHVKSRIRHVLDYRKPSFWIVIGAAVVIVLLIVSLGSNPGGTDETAPGTDTTEAGTAHITGTIETAEAFADVIIQNRADFMAVFDAEAIEAKQSFAADSGSYELLAGTNSRNAAYSVFKALAEGDTSENDTKYQDPVTAAVALLHLGEGSGTVTETIYAAGQQYLFYREDADRPGEGSVVNVHYVFAEDDSAIDIPMVMAEETAQLWFLSFGDPDSAGDREYGALPGDICAREVYGEVELSLNGGSVPYSYVENGSYTGENAHIQVSGYGIYLLDADGFRCVRAEEMPTRIPWDVTYLPVAYDTANTYGEYRAAQGANEWSGIKVYYLTDPEEELTTESWMPTVLREYDLESGESVDRALPLDLQIGNGLRVYDGYCEVYNTANPAITIRLPFVSPDSLYAGKSWEELAGAVDGSYAASRGMDILAYPGVIFDVSERTEDETFALLDLDGDGFSEKISLYPADTEGGYSLERYISYMNLGLREMNCYDLRGAVLEVNGQAQEISGSTGNMSNSIFAFSPDGEQILIALYDDGESADPLTRFYHYQNGKLVETGQIEQDIRRIWIQDGQITVIEPYETMQNDYIRRSYRVTETGNLREVPQEEYALGGRTELELLQDMTLYRTPDGETFVMPAGSKVRMTKLDATQEWICLEAADGTEGWFRRQNDVDYEEYFDGLYRAG